MVISNKPVQKIRFQTLSDSKVEIDTKTVDLSKLGYFGGYLKNDIMPKNYDIMLIKSLVAFTKKHKMMEEERLGIREIFPHFDLLDGDGNPLMNSDWIQRYPKNIKEKLHYGGQYFSIYLTDRASKNDQKIILLYGIQYLRDDILADTMSIWSKGVKIVELYALDRYPQVNQVKLFRTPILVNVNDLLDVAFSFRDIDHIVNMYDMVEMRDNIKLLGYVAEPIGRNVM